ncbi:AAA family ATPase [Thermodesulfobacteriota bacterium]
MYKLHFGLKENPFNMTPDPRYIYLSDIHDDTLLQLIYGINHRKGFLLVIGEIGTGKTTISRALLDRLDSNVETALLLNPYLSEPELLKTILDDFGVECESDSMKDMIDLLNEFLITQKSNGGNAALIIDEAQNLPIKSMELIRMLSNLETNTEKLLQIVLIGQPELKKKLASENLRQLNQRITIRTQLAPLSMKDTKGYITYRLTKSGALNTNIFTSSAVREVFIYTKGYPRLINSLCDRALLCAYSFDKNSVDKGIIKKAALDVIDDLSIRRKANYYQCAFYSMVILLLLVIFAPILADYVEDTILTDRPEKTTQIISEAKASKPPASNEQKLAAISDSDPVVEKSGTTSSNATADINKILSEGETTKFDEPEESVSLSKDAEVVNGEKPPVFTMSNGKYMTDDLNYSLEASVMTLLSIWNEDKRTINIIKKFDKPSATIEYMLDKLATYELLLKSEYKIVHKSMSLRRIRKMALPTIVALRDDIKVNSFYYALITSYEKNAMTLLEPKKGLVKISNARFRRKYMNDAIVMYKSLFIKNKALRINMTSADVMILEDNLKILGYFLEEPDSYFDEDTKDAVMLLQDSKGLKPDGHVGTDTKIALIKEVNKSLLGSIRE